MYWAEAEEEPEGDRAEDDEADPTLLLRAVVLMFIGAGDSAITTPYPLCVVPAFVGKIGVRASIALL